MGKIRVITGTVALTVALVPAPTAHADGLSSCTEDPTTLRAESQKTIEIIGEKIPLGPFEGASTVPQFGNKSLSGVNVQMECSQIMAYYANGRIDGTINAPDGPGLT